MRGAVGRADVATVRFAALDDAEIDAYVASGEPLHVAGAFTIDSLGGPFIERVEGDPSTVVGMSLSTLRDLVRELGVDWPSLWNRADAGEPDCPTRPRHPPPSTIVDARKGRRGSFCGSDPKASPARPVG